MLTPEERRLRHNESCKRYRLDHPENSIKHNRTYRLKHTEKLLQKNRDYRANDPEQRKINDARYRSKHPEKVSAQSAVRDAVRRGKLVPTLACQLCWNTDAKLHGHHQDYSKRLEVIWLCPECHGYVHRKAISATK